MCGRGYVRSCILTVGVIKRASGNFPTHSARASCGLKVCGIAWSGKYCTRRTEYDLPDLDHADQWVGTCVCVMHILEMTTW